LAGEEEIGSEHGHTKTQEMLRNTKRKVKKERTCELAVGAKGNCSCGRDR